MVSTKRGPKYCHKTMVTYIQPMDRDIYQLSIHWIFEAFKNHTKTIHFDRSLSFLQSYSEYSGCRVYNFQKYNTSTYKCCYMANRLVWSKNLSRGIKKNKEKTHADACKKKNLSWITLKFKFNVVYILVGYFISCKPVPLLL